MSNGLGLAGSGVGFVDETARLEAAYWRLLRFYPRGWRRHRGAELVSVLLDVALAAGRDRPTARDRVELFVFGLLARWEAIFAAVPVRMRDQAVDISSVLLFGVTVCVVAFGEVTAWRAGPSPHPWVGMGPSTGQVPLAVLLVAFVCRLLAFRVTAQVLFLAGALLTPVAVLVGKVFGLDRPPAALMVVLSVAAAVSAVSAPMPRSRRRAWRAVAGAVFAGYLLLFLEVSTLGMMLEDYIVSLSFYYFQSSSLMASALLWLTLPMFVAALGVDVVRRGGGLAVSVGVACLPWWGLWIAFVVTQLWEAIGWRLSRCLCK